MALPLTVAFLSLGAALPAVAQQQEGLVVVNIEDVANNIARDLEVDVSQIPVTVEAPIGVAANVCGIEANVLAEQARGGTAECDAQTTSQALNQIVQRRLA